MIYTFYSYKGGVGRTMALANIAELFYRSGLRVLMVDWDLEAPGLERFFPNAEGNMEKPGLMDMLLRYKAQMAQGIKEESASSPESPMRYVIDLYHNAKEGGLFLLPAGKRSTEAFADYAESVLSFDWRNFYEDWKGELYFNWFREQLEAEFDVILIDSRTGVTEMGGVCTYQLADSVVIFCATNQQNLDGAYRMAKNFIDPGLQEARNGRALRVLVIPARVEETAEKRDLNSFQNEFTRIFGTENFPLEDSLAATPQEMWKLRIPYIPFYAFNEVVAVRENENDRHPDMYDAYLQLSVYLSLQAPGNSKIRQRFKVEEISAIGGRSVAIGGNVQSNVIVTGGGAVISGSVVISSGDFIGRDKIETFQTLETAYLNYLLISLGGLSLRSIDPKAAGEAETRFNLSAVYTKLFTLTSEEHQQFSRQQECSLGNRGPNTERRVSAVAQLERNPRLVLLGDPGSGKSTFVSYAALCLAGERLGNTEYNLARFTEPLPQEKGDEQDPAPQVWTHGALLPVRVVLRDFAARGLPPAGKPASADTLWTFIAAELGETLAEFAPHLKRLLREQGGLLLLDGLDEVAEVKQRREQLRQAVEGFAAAFPKCRILVTSRTYAYQQQDWRLAGFSEVVLAPFSRGQIERFVERWYAYIAKARDLHAADVQGRAELLKRAIFSSDQLQGLAARPILLTLMASLHAWRGGSLPEKREELYADTVDLLLDWWERPKVVFDREQVILQQPSLAEWLRVDRDAVRALLEHLACTAHMEQPVLVGTGSVSERELLTGLLSLSRNPDVKPARLVEYFSQRAGLLVPCAVGMYTFPHRTIQEYLAACYLTDYQYPDRVAELARREPNRWREVALLAGAKAARGSSSAVWSLVEALCYADASSDKILEADAYGALIAGQVLVENALLTDFSPRNQPKINRVQANLARLLETGGLNATERAQGGVLLAHLGDPRFRSDSWYLPAEPLLGFVEIPAGPFVMGSAEQDIQAYDDEKPQHIRDLPTYHLARYPVTTAQFRAFVNESAYKPANLDCLNGFDNHPVTQITWFDALAYCQWVTECLRVWEGVSEPLRLFLREGVVRLPSEAEWEKASCGMDKRRYPWGDDSNPDRGNYDDTGIGTTSAVGCFPGGASPYGVEDLSGNVWEWTLSSFSDYPYTSGDERESLDTKIKRVLRGGAFDSNAQLVRCTTRLASSPDTRSDNIGFRIVVSKMVLE